MKTTATQQSNQILVTLKKTLATVSKNQCNEIFEIMLVLEGEAARVITRDWEEAQQTLAKWAEQACQGQSKCDVSLWLETDEVITIAIDLWELWGLSSEEFLVELQSQIVADITWQAKKITRKRWIKRAVQALYTQRVERALQAFELRAISV